MKHAVKAEVKAAFATLKADPSDSLNGVDGISATECDTLYDSCINIIDSLGPHLTTAPQASERIDENSLTDIFDAIYASSKRDLNGSNAKMRMHIHALSAWCDQSESYTGDQLG